LRFLDYKNNDNYLIQAQNRDKNLRLCDFISKFAVYFKDYHEDEYNNWDIAAWQPYLSRQQL
jgi:hypothetical protein